MRVNNMKSKEVRVCILRIEGTNCEHETCMAFRLAGASPEIVHLKQLTGPCPSSLRRSLEEYHILAIPGGFSAGDYVRAGAIFAARVKSTLANDLKEFVSAEKPIIGICNGFQVLVELGMLPAVDEIMSEQAQAALATNDSGRFECLPTFLRVESSGRCIFTRRMKRGDIVMFPSAHAEGKFTLPEENKEGLLSKMIDNDQIVFRYVDQRGHYAGYPWNPNGSLMNIAGVCNSYGTVLGLMPHPERVVFRYNHPDWTRTKLDPCGRGDGTAIFESAVDYITRKF